jgi:hypothetical protein
MPGKKKMITTTSIANARLERLNYAEKTNIRVVLILTSTAITAEVALINASRGNPALKENATSCATLDSRIAMAYV